MTKRDDSRGKEGRNLASSPFRILSNPAKKTSEFPCDTCDSACCGSIPLTRKEYVAILRHLRTVPREERNRLAAQKRDEYTCCFVDTERWQCSIYGARPLICKNFGYAPKVACKYAPQHANRMTDEELDRQTAQNVGASQGDIGWITGLTLDWPEIKHDLLLGGNNPRKRKVGAICPKCRTFVTEPNPQVPGGFLCRRCGVASQPLGKI